MGHVVAHGTLDEVAAVSCVLSASAGAQKIGDQEIGRSRGGVTTKLHVAVYALGNPLRVILSTEHFRYRWAPNLIDLFPAQAVIADKGYDADHFDAEVEATGA